MIRSHAALTRGKGDKQMPRATHTLLPRNRFAKRHYEAIALAMQHALVPYDPARRNQWESVHHGSVRSAGDVPCASRLGNRNMG